MEQDRWQREIEMVQPYWEADAGMMLCVESVLQDGSLSTVYQPIVHHANAQVFAVEMLTRPIYQGRPVRPDEWFQSAFRCNRSAEADLLAIRHGLSLFSSPPHKLCDHLFINVMPSSLLKPGFQDDLLITLESVGIHPSQVVIEVIEYVSYDVNTLSDVLGRLRRLGFKVALDDFGRGSTSFAALVQLQLDFIKVDRALVQGIAFSEPKQKLLSLMVDYMGRSDTVIAEGVESQEDLDVIKSLGVDLSQGYYWCHPLPLEEVSVFAGSLVSGI